MLLECKILHILNKISFLKSHVMAWVKRNKLQMSLVFMYFFFLETKINILNFGDQGIIYPTNATLYDVKV